VAILVRDRADAYALAGRLAAPDALQVADRFHLVRHVSDALKVLLHSRRWHPSASGCQSGLSPHPAATPTVSPTDASLKALQSTPRKRALWEAVQQHRDRGPSLRQLARTFGLDRRTLRRYLAADQPPMYPSRRPRPTQLSPYSDHLAARWALGCHHARRLSHELVQRGYQGSESMVRQVLQPWRLRQEARPSALTASPRSRLLLPPAGGLTEVAQEAFARVLQANPL
jgi:hypothetical protein